MSDKVHLPKKKTGTNAGRPETEEVPLTVTATPKKRKGGRMTTGEPPHADRPPRGVQGRRSDVGAVRSAAPAAERQHQRCPHTVPAHRRVPVDVHRSHKSNMSNPGSRPHRRAGAPPGPPRTMLQHAWHTVLNSDPLADSDEDCPDEHLRLDYNRRMQVITRLRGRPPTPEAECSQVTPV